VSTVRDLSVLQMTEMAVIAVEEAIEVGTSTWEIVEGRDWARMAIEDQGIWIVRGSRFERICLRFNRLLEKKLRARFSLVA
jgi:hypothetical protein